MSIVPLTRDDGTVNGQGGDLAFVRVLGPVQVVTGSGRSLDLPSASQRRLVALLAAEAPRSLRADWICDVLAVSPSALRTTVSRVRRAVGDGTIAGSQGRYRLAVPVDAALFTSALSQVSSRDDRTEALERALAIWTGPPFDEFSAEGWAGPEVVRLTELHASAVEDHATGLIAARRWAAAVAGLQAHVAVHPLRDRPRGLLLQALAGAGRQADALGAFRDYRAIDMIEIPERIAMDALDLAERARLVVDVGPSARTMRFVHALVAGAVYSELPGRRRRRLHARAAQVLEKRSGAPATDLAAQLARHCALGGLLAEALRWARLAGDHAADRLSPAEAARWYRTALEHTAIVEVADHERADLLARLGRVQHQINDPAALATLTEAAALARRCGATPIVAQAALATDRGFLHLGSLPAAQVAIIESALEVIGDGDAATRARLLALLAEALPRNAPGARRAALAREAVALADASPDPALLARIGSSVLYAGPVQPTSALAHAIISVASGPREIASDLLDAAMATGFRGVPADVMWMTSMLGYAILAIGLSDLDAAAQLLAIIEPHVGEVATNLGPVAAYAGRRPPSSATMISPNGT